MKTYRFEPVNRNIAFMKFESAPSRTFLVVRRFVAYCDRVWSAVADGQLENIDKSVLAARRASNRNFLWITHYR